MNTSRKISGICGSSMNDPTRNLLAAFHSIPMTAPVPSTPGRRWEANVNFTPVVPTPAVVLPPPPVIPIPPNPFVGPPIPGVIPPEPIGLPPYLQAAIDQGYALTQADQIRVNQYFTHELAWNRVYGRNRNPQQVVTPPTHSEYESDDLEILSDVTNYEEFQHPIYNTPEGSDSGDDTNTDSDSDLSDTYRNFPEDGYIFDNQENIIPSENFRTSEHLLQNLATQLGYG